MGWPRRTRRGDALHPRRGIGDERKQRGINLRKAVAAEALDLLEGLLGEFQGTNDFLVFGTVAGASFLASSLLHSSGWTTIDWLVLPCVATGLSLLVWGSVRLDPPKRPHV
jgi:uncharacterized membrane protein (UPF0136 family)